MKSVGTEHLCDPSLLVNWGTDPKYNLVQSKSFKFDLGRNGILSCLLTLRIPLEFQDL